MQAHSRSAAERSRDLGALRMRSFRDGDGHVIALAGELCLASAAAVERELRRVELSRAHVIAVDLRELTFIDSTGIRLIMQADRRCSGTGRLVLVRGTGAVQRLFEIRGLAGTLPFVDQLPSDDAARRSTTAAAGRIGVSPARAAHARRVAASSRVSQGVLAAAVRELRSRRRPGKPQYGQDGSARV
jgi:anti-anti-sigma factor